MTRIKLKFMLIVLQYIYHQIEGECIEFDARIMCLQDEINDKLEEVKQ